MRIFAPAKAKNKIFLLFYQIRSLLHAAATLVSALASANICAATAKQSAIFHPPFDAEAAEKFLKVI